MRKFILLALLPLLLAGCAYFGGDSCPTVPGTARVAKYVDGNGHTGITGRVYIRETGQPLADAFVNIYPDTISNLLGPSQSMSRPTDKDGLFQVDLQPGTYFVVARKRVNGNPTGALSPGDLYSEHQRIVTDVVDGKLAVVDLSVVPMNNPMFFKQGRSERETTTGIRGRLVDKDGKPVFGAFGMAYTDADVKRLPDFGSTLSDADGRFTLYLPKGGTYYLAGRIHVYDMPRTGEPYGRLETPITVKDGSFVDAPTLVLEPFTGEYQKGKSRRPY